MGVLNFRYALICLVILILAASFDNSAYLHASEDEDPDPEELIVNKITRMELLKLFRSSGEDISTLDFLEKLNLYKEQHDCDEKIIIQPTIQFSATQLEIAEIFTSGSLLEKLSKLRDYSYKTFPMYFLESDDSPIAPVSAYPAEAMIDSLKNSKWGVLCYEYSYINKSLWRKYGTNKDPVTVKIGAMEEANGHVLTHTVLLVYEKRADGIYAVALDGMFGQLLPLNQNDEMVSIKEMQEMLQKKDFIDNVKISFTSDEVLHKKRFLTDNVWPCNFFIDPETKYYRSQPNASKKYEMHKKEHIELMSPNFSYEKYTQDIIKLLLANVPKHL